MDDADFSKFLKAEMKYIDDAKWYEGIRTNSDPGNTFVENLVEKDAKAIRDRWNVSKCKHCTDSHICGNNLKVECSNFKPS